MWEFELVLVSVENACLSQHVFGNDMILSMHMIDVQGRQLSWQLMVAINLSQGIPVFKLHLFP